MNKYSSHKYLSVPRSPEFEEEERRISRKQAECSHTHYMVRCSCGLVLGSETTYTCDPKERPDEILI
jgi:hypothetical protein